MAGQMQRVLILALFGHAMHLAQTLELLGGAPFVQPPVVASKAGVLDTVLDLRPAEFEAVTDGKDQAPLRMTLIAFNGSLPPPTIRILPGDLVRLQYRNRLPEPEVNVACVKYTNASVWPQEQFCRPSTSNLHWHGAHVSEVLPSADIALLVTPGKSYQYETHFPADHMPGTLFIHPHVHGSSTVQVASGAASALIVSDPPGFLPQELDEISGGARDITWLVQRFELTSLLDFAKKSADPVTQVRLGEQILGATELGRDEFAGINDFVLVNGVFRPKLELQEGLWYRWRVIYAAWTAGSLDFAVRSLPKQCEVVLLAKDGIYLRDFPRTLQGPARLPAGGRADVLVRCQRSSAGNVANITAVDGRVIATAEILARPATVQASPELPQWSPVWPKYLQDTQELAPSTGCSCLTELGSCTDNGGSNCINGRPFDASFMMHKTRPNAVVERQIMGVEAHPYHQHLYPFQLIDGFPVSEYFQPGDWQDTWLDLSLPKNASMVGMTVRMRYRTTNLTGHMMVHCHRLNHEDQGMMSTELVLESEDAPCSCDNYVPPSLAVATTRGPADAAQGNLRR